MLIDAAVNILNYFNKYVPYIKKGFVIDIPLFWKAMIAVFAVAVIVLAVFLRKREKFETLGAVAFTLLAVYLFVFLVCAIILRQAEPHPRLSLDVFWAYKKWLVEKQNFFPEIAGNVLIMIPIGFLLPVCLKKSASVNKRFLFTVGTGFAISFSIELMQFIFKKGLADANDLLNNLLGIIIGFLLYLITVRVAEWVKK